MTVLRITVALALALVVAELSSSWGVSNAIGVVVSSLLVVVTISMVKAARVS